jgi:oligopeptide transport system substrate-binding protein
VPDYLSNLRSQGVPFTLLLLSMLLIVLAACGGSTTNPSAKATPAPAARQVLTFPNVGTEDIGVLDPALGPDANSAIAVGMIYSGLVRYDMNLNIIADQAKTWNISDNNKVYTFHLQPGISFSDGTPVTAQTYVYTLTRALFPEVKSPIASFFEQTIVGSNDVSSGKTRVLRGIRALDDQTLQITLTQSTPYFLEVLANPLYFPLNKNLIDKYGQVNWVNHAVGNAIGTGPFEVKEWDHNIKMVLVPNPHYYGAHTKLREVDMLFVNDLNIALQSYRAGQYDLDWNIAPEQLVVARSLPGFTIKPLLQTDLLFFNNKMPPFDNVAIRQAFAYATDKAMLAQTVFNDAVVPAATIIPPGMAGYQPNYPGLPFDKDKAKTLLESVYPDPTKVPSITFSYPDSQVTSGEAGALQQMWQTVLGIQVSLFSMEPDAYNDEMANHEVQFGFTQWGADFPDLYFPDPYDWLTLNLVSTAANNDGEWNNPAFDQAVMQAEQTSGDARIALYNKAEQIAISDVGLLPLDHRSLAAIIPSRVHGVSLNGEGLFFGDWSDVYLVQR